MNKRKYIIKLLVYLVPIPIIFFSLFIGVSENVTFANVFSSLFTNQNSNNIVSTVIYNIRLPRVLLVFITGGVLSASGSAMQAIFRNPLVDPYILGMSSGAAFGAALALSVLMIPVQIPAFVFGMIAVSISYIMAKKNKNVTIISLILAGIITNGVFTALLTLVQIISNPLKLQSIIYWIMGNFHTASWDKVVMVLPPVVLGTIILFIFRWKLNVIALGDEEAESVGVNPTKIKIWVLIGVTLASSAVVAVSGIIGLYGLIIPHAVRIIFGVDNKSTLMLNFVLGGSLLILIDDISRSLNGFEIPIGIFTMLLCAPFFAWLLKRENIGWQQ